MVAGVSALHVTAFIKLNTLINKKKINFQTFISIKYMIKNDYVNVIMK